MGFRTEPHTNFKDNRVVRSIFHCILFALNFCKCSLGAAVLSYHFKLKIIDMFENSLFWKLS